MKGCLALKRPCASLMAVLLLSGSVAWGQDKHAPKIETLTTKDGVELKVTYYKSSAGKDATPVVILPDWKDSRSVVHSLALHLQNPPKSTPNDPQAAETHKSFAVLTVDLRGHGDSTKQTVGGERREIDAAKLTRNDLTGMVQYDMEAVRKFLVDKNDASELNINRLSIIGAGLGASVATNWAAVDWSAPPLAVGKQGQDVKALVLLSPRWKDKGLSLQNPLRQAGVRQEVAFCMLYGERDRQVLADVKRIEKQLEKFHPDPPTVSAETPDTLMVLAAPTSLQGTKMLKEGGVAAEKTIIGFLRDNVQSQDFEWTQRKRL